MIPYSIKHNCCATFELLVIESVCPLSYINISIATRRSRTSYCSHTSKNIPWLSILDIPLSRFVMGPCALRTNKLRTLFAWCSKPGFFESSFNNVVVCARRGGSKRKSREWLLAQNSIAFIALLYVLFKEKWYKVW